jgi:hypothetical protein
VYEARLAVPTECRVPPRVLNRRPSAQHTCRRVAVSDVPDVLASTAQRPPQQPHHDAARRSSRLRQISRRTISRTQKRLPLITGEVSGQIPLTTARDPAVDLGDRSGSTERRTTTRSAARLAARARWLFFVHGIHPSAVGSWRSLPVLAALCGSSTAAGARRQLEASRPALVTRPHRIG